MSGQDQGWKIGTGVENRLIVEIVTSVSVRGYVIYSKLVYNLVCNKRQGQGQGSKMSSNIKKSL